MTKCIYLLTLGLWLLPHRARAFSDPALYAESPLAGGGGGRFFTGSVNDGYTCAVCHSGGIEPVVSVTGLPLNGFVPDTTYEILIRWTEPKISHALTLEFVTPDGKRAGKVELPDPDDVGPEGRCEQDDEGEVAAYLLTADSRRIVGVSDCGAANVLVRFTAPSEPEVRLTASVVRSDSEGTVEGDGVLDLSYQLHRTGTAGATRDAGCIVWHGSTGSSRWLLLSLALWLGRRRGARLSRSS